MSEIDLLPLDGPDQPSGVDTSETAKRVTLAITIVAAFIVVVDNTVLNVAIPTILREFDTSLPTLEWVVTGYALTFATLLIIGGRLGDVYGHRRIFMIGTALFGLGSLIAALSQNVGQLILGEAIIEGIGASLMLPATLAILSSTFQGRERASAFAAWGATAGVGAALGPVIGGFLTTNYSWRWSFGSCSPSARAPATAGGTRWRTSPSPATTSGPRRGRCRSSRCCSSHRSPP
jgi:MFS family permease